MDVLAAIAKDKHASVPQVALAWVLANKAVTSVIIGARKIDQLEDNLGTVELTLNPQELATLNEASQTPLPYPLWMEAMGSDRRPGESRNFDAAKK